MQYQPELWLGRLLQPVFIGSTLVTLPEFAVEIRLIVETGPVKDLRHGQLSGSEQVSGMLQPDMFDEFSRRHIGHGLEPAIQLHLAHGKFLFQNSRIEVHIIEVIFDDTDQRTDEFLVGIRQIRLTEIDLAVIAEELIEFMTILQQFTHSNL